jgi:hypothetical protein
MMESSHLTQLTPPLLTVYPMAIRFDYDLLVSTCLKNPSGGSRTKVPAIFFFLAGTTFFKASPNRNKNRQRSNKVRDDF